MPLQRLCLALFPALSLCLSLAWSSPATAALVSYSTYGDTYSQNFNTLATSGTGITWEDGTTLAGWFFQLENGSPATSYNTSSGSPNQGVALSIGSSADRALGSQNLNTNGLTFRYGMALVNNTGAAIDSFSLTYTGEQWRVVTGEATADRLEFSYGVFAAGAGSLSAAGYVDANDLDFEAPITNPGGASAGLPGNDPANRRTRSQVVSGFTWGVGEELWLRWADTNVGGNPGTRSMMGVDDLTFTAVPEPSTYLLLGMLGVGGWALRRRKATNGG